jgi:hypothetical protein
MKALRNAVLFISILFAGFLLQSCEESTTDATVTPTFDAQLVGVWYDTTSKEGVEIKTDGSIKHLIVDNQGKLAYDSDPTFVSGKIVKAEGGKLETQEQYIENSATVTFVGKGRYTIGSGGTTMTINIDSINGQAASHVFRYIKKSVGDVVVTSPAPSGNSLSFTMESQTYNFTVVSGYMDGTLIDVTASNSTVSFFNFFTPRRTGVHTVDGDSVGLWFEIGPVIYTSDTGTITISTINGKTTQGSFALVVQDQNNATVKKNISGTYSVTMP